MTMIDIELDPPKYDADDNIGKKGIKGERECRGKVRKGRKEGRG